MLTAWTLSTLLVVAAPPLPAGTLLTYRGSLAPRADDGSAPRKAFTLHWAALPATPRGQPLAWIVEEEGRSGWSWLNRFGRLELSDPAGENDPPAHRPALLYLRSDGRYVVELPGPLPPLPAGELRPGAAWSQDTLAYRVQAPAMRGGRACLPVEVRSPYGHQRTLWIDPQRGLLVAAAETVFLGQGQEHRLTLELQDEQAVPEHELNTLADRFEAWRAFRDRLGWKARDRNPQLSEAQLRALRAALPDLVHSSSSPGMAERWLAPLVVAAQADAQDQRQRVAAVAALRQAALGRPLGAVRLKDLSGQALPPQTWTGKVLILHFWEYRDLPLEEPYGQVGYLDYLFRRRAAGGVVVLGVHLDPQADERGPRPASLAAARRLKSFMNLSYPVVVDEGDLLKHLGDPRPSGAPLPLFVVVGKDGIVAEYHPGFYEVKANEGLAELDALVTRLLAAP